MKSRQWIETFLRLADSGAPATDYRKQLGLKTNALSAHINRIGEFRKELAQLKEQEERDERNRRRDAELAKEAAEEARLRDIEEQPTDDAGTSSSETPDRSAPERDEETLGTREDSVED